MSVKEKKALKKEESEPGFISPTMVPGFRRHYALLL